MHDDDGFIFLLSVFFLFFLVRPEAIACGAHLSFAVVFLFSPRVISELRVPIAAKFCTMLLSMFYFIIPVRNFGEPPQKNFRGQKHAKCGPISVDFKVWRRISPERMKILQSVSYSFDSDSSRVRRNKSVEDRSSNLGDPDVSLYPPKAHFSKKNIFRPLGSAAPPKFLHTLENHQVLLAHPHR